MSLVSLTQAAMDESFYLSNIVPQDLDNNRDFWNRLEIYCRDLTKTYKDVWVLSGPLILPNVEEDGKKYVKYQVRSSKSFKGTHCLWIWHFWLLKHLL